MHGDGLDDDYITDQLEWGLEKQECMQRVDSGGQEPWKI